MRGINHVFLACFTAALQRRKDVQGPLSSTQSDAKITIRCVQAITDFCPMAQYWSHTLQTIGYMTQYLQQFHECMHVFSEYRASKADQEEAAKVAKDLAEGHARQATIDQYFKLVATQRAKRSADDRDERQQVVREILQETRFNFPKLHLLSHYA